jgi:asparagine synthase (glutamine-hydrolysing)|tara:strand:- start:4500 stop:5705 length:1206 start_codon:yes stop_codon:yes gene_type:complete
MEINSDSLKHILTLRYDPSFEPLLPKQKWENFQEKESFDYLNTVENTIQNTLKKYEKSLKRKPIVSLSSGIDSTLVLTLLRDLYPDIEIDSMSLSFSESFDESPQAKKLAEHFQTNHHVIKIENFLENLPHAISIVGAPFWDLHWYEVAKTAKSLGNLLISGDGGDELFGGYTFRYQKFISLVSKNSTPYEKIQSYLSCHGRDWVSDQPNVFGRKLNFVWDDIFSRLKPYFDNPLDSLNQVFLADFNGKLLYNMSPIYNKFHNHFDLDYLAPILSDELIAFATHIPIQQKYDSTTNSGKLLLRQILKKYKVLNLVTTKKQGFSINTVNLWKSYGQKLCNSFLIDGKIVNEGWINSNWIKKYINEKEPKPEIVNKFLGLLAFEIWFRLFISKDMKSHEKLNV